MQLYAQLFLDGKPIAPSDLSSITIKNQNVDKIVNSVARRYKGSTIDNTAVGSKAVAGT